HELGSPLTSLRMAVELLGRDDAPAPRALVDAAQEDVARLQDLAQRLLDLSRARATSIPLERRNVDLREVIPRTVKLFALQAREKGIALESAVADAGLTIAGDPTKLTWALSNLLANALRYTPAGGSVRVEAASADGTVVVSVTDTGDGIPPDQQERIFERFVQSGEGGNIGAAGLGRSEFDVVFSDVRMAGMDGLALLHEIRRRRPEAVVVLMTAYATVAQAVEAMRAGAYDYLVKPFSLEQVGLLLARVLEVQTLKRENRTLRRALDEPVLLDSASPLMQRALDTARQAAGSDVTVLLTGESGTGKNVLASAIHAWSPRQRGAFVTVACTTLA